VADGAAAAVAQRADVVELTDDALMEQFMETGAVPPEKLGPAISKAVATGHLVPVLFTSARNDVGVKELLDAIVRYAPSPVVGKQRKLIVGEGETAFPARIDALQNGRDPDHIAGLVVEYSYASDLDPEFRQRAEDEFRACPAAVTHGDFSACNRFDVMARLAEIRAPTLVVCGREDRMTPVKYSVHLATQIPNACLVFIEHAGHSVMIEQPDETNKTLIDFVEFLKALA
jgi:pimeloyl-ACP methyl ester carboxylesterase